MTQDPFPIQKWLDAMKTSLNELLRTTLNMQGAEIASRQYDLPWRNTMGAYVPLVGKDFSLHIGLVSTSDGCHAIARSLLNRPAHELITEEDMADAIREVANIIAGMSKKIMEGDVSASTIGLPLFINGHIQLTKEQQAGSEMIRIGDIICYLMVVRQR